jgi:hypothetical protein
MITFLFIYDGGVTSTQLAFGIMPCAVERSNLDSRNFIFVTRILHSTKRRPNSGAGVADAAPCVRPTQRHVRPVGTGVLGLGLMLEIARAPIKNLGVVR